LRIDGRLEVKGHGPVQMPVWSNFYGAKAADDCKGFAYSPEQFIRVRILSLMDDVYALQTRRRAPRDRSDGPAPCA
jgi:hypothetical protein